jgi:sortase A
MLAVMRRALRLHFMLLAGVLIITLSLLVGGRFSITARAEHASAPASARPPNAPTRIVIPKIGVDVPVSVVGLERKGNGYQWELPRQGVAWHRMTATPGQQGNVVLSGHNGTRGNRVFRNLHKLDVGDTFTLYVGDRAYIYRVSQRVITRELFASKKQREANARWMAPTTDERVTLVTCYPWWTNTHRLIIVGHRLTATPDARIP